ncbi:MAG TPA: nucleotidyltransferase family protein [Caulobacteraceae bacterium]|nr:nucleotidyltransferase family protein [Caulobacteraceae bacterium]
MKAVKELPPAFRLACACCAWPPSPKRDAAVRAASAPVDWERFLRVVARQRVPGLAHAALRAAGVRPPPGAGEALARAAQSGAARALALAAESVRLQALLRAEAIEALCVKGAALAELAYGGQGLKHCRDIDLVVAPVDAERAYGLLQREGYRPSIPKGPLTAEQRRLVFGLHKDMELRDGSRQLSVELHWRLIDNPVLLPRVGAGSPTQTVQTPSGPLTTLGDLDLFAYLVTHGATHGWFRLKWLADLNAWLAGKTGAEIGAYYAHSEALEVDACAGQALALCERLLGFAPPPQLRKSLQTRKVGGLVASALDAMVGPDGEVELADRPFGPFRLLAPQFARGRGLGFFLAQCRLLLDSLDDRLDFPLPKALGFLYPILRLPFWLIRIRRRRRRNRMQSA